MDSASFLKDALNLSPEDKLSFVLFLLGSVGYEEEADRVARTSTNILKNEQIVESISRYQFPNTGKTRLMYAAMTGNLKRLNFIASLGARVNMTTGGDHGFSKWAALHFASWNGHTECVRSLCDRGAMIDAQTERGLTALHYACIYGYLDVVRLLCERGAQINLQNIDGRTALHDASQLGYTECVRTLLDRAAVIDAQDRYGRTALHWACDSGHLDVVRLLCENGAQIDLQSHFGGTALDNASSCNNIDITRYLCERGANTLLLYHGKTPYTRACQWHGTESPIARLLKSYPH